MGSVLCEHCTGLCCKYVALPLETPTTRRDFDDIRWYVMHQGITVFCEEGDWYVQFGARCQNLQADNRCGIYESRPAICREYKAGECDYQGGDYSYDCFLTTPEEVEAYAISKLGKRGVFTTKPAGRNGSANGSVRRLKVLLSHA